jgi:hypothetical protein
VQNKIKLFYLMHKPPNITQHAYIQVIRFITKIAAIYYIKYFQQIAFLRGHMVTAVTVTVYTNAFQQRKRCFARQEGMPPIGV